MRAIVAQSWFEAHEVFTKSLRELLCVLITTDLLHLDVV